MQHCIVAGKQRKHLVLDPATQYSGYSFLYTQDALHQWLPTYGPGATRSTEMLAVFVSRPFSILSGGPEFAEVPVWESVEERSLSEMLPLGPPERAKNGPPLLAFPVSCGVLPHGLPV